MTSAPNLSKQTVNFIWIYTNILYGQDNEVIDDLDLLLRSQQDVKCQMRTSVLSCSTLTGVTAYVL